MTKFRRSLTASAVAALFAGLAAAPVGAQDGQAQEPPQTLEQQPSGSPEGQLERAQQPQGLYSLRVKEVAGKRVSNVTGDKLGQVEEVVRGADDGRLYVVVSVGGFLGIGDKQVALPVDDLQLSEDALVMTTDMDEDTLKQQAETFQEDKYQEVTDDVTLAEASGAGAGGGGMGAGQELPSFSSLDKDGDGIVTREEASDTRTLMDNWGQADQDQDGKLTESEFSAFEQGQARESPDMQPGGMQQHDQRGMMQQPGDGSQDGAPPDR